MWQLLVMAPFSAWIFGSGFGHHTSPTCSPSLLLRVTMVHKFHYDTGMEPSLLRANKNCKVGRFLRTATSRMWTTAVTLGNSAMDRCCTTFDSVLSVTPFTRTSEL